jgi:hypothetical protein
VAVRLWLIVLLLTCQPAMAGQRILLIRGLMDYLPGASIAVPTTSIAVGVFCNETPLHGQPQDSEVTMKSASGLARVDGRSSDERPAGRSSGRTPFLP